MLSYRLVALALLAVASSGCVSMKTVQGQAVARLDSTKSVAEFAECVSEALSAPVQTGDGLTFIYLKNAAGIGVTRWDFLHTSSGSQAELRTDDPDRTGIEAVRRCT